MKLTDIDLNDKSEVSAAHALLAAILGNAVSDGPRPIQTTPAAFDPATGQASFPVTMAGTNTYPAPEQDAAAVFGAAPLSGIPAPSTAGADPSLTAPAGLPGISAALPGTPTPAPFIAPEVHAQMLAGLTNPAPGVELDSTGLPWDARIHASTKSKKKDGGWTALRGLNDEAKVKQIEAELRAMVRGQQPGAAAPAPSATPLPLPTTSAPLAGAEQSDPVTFEHLMPRVTQATIGGILPPTALQQICGALGLPSVVALQTNPGYVPHAWAQLKAAYPALQ